MTPGSAGPSAGCGVAAQAVDEQDDEPVRPLLGPGPAVGAGDECFPGGEVAVGGPSMWGYTRSYLPIRLCSEFHRNTVSYMSK